ncbi:MAG: hypothetical protein AB2693_21580 [Candidatus Thiodiazotropha sp.]
MKGVEASQQVGRRKHRHSEGDVLLKCVTSLNKPSSTHIKSRKRSISEGEAKNLDLSKESPKSDQRTESKMSLLEDDENDYVDTIISSLRRNSVTEKYRQDMLKRNGFYAEHRSGLAQADLRGVNTGLNEHKFRNSYCGSFGSLDSIDSWSSCNSIENENDLNEGTSEAVNNEDIVKWNEAQICNGKSVDFSLKDSPDAHLAQSREETQGNDNEQAEVAETSSWIDSSYWNLELLNSEVKVRKWSVSGGSRRQRLKELRRRSCGDYSKQFDYKLYEKYLKNEKAKLNNMNNDSLAKLSEEQLDADVKENTEKTPDDIGTNSDTLHTFQRSSQKYILDYLKRDKGSSVSEIEGKEAEFVCLSKEQIAFCSGKHGRLQGGGDDVELVFDAINNEAKKLENSTKDLMVVFFVGKLNHS